MKLSLCFLALLFALASCKTSFRPHPEISQAPTDVPPQVMAEFYGGLFSRFDLDRPTQIINECLSGFSAGVFLEELFVFNQLLIDLNARDFKRVHQDSFVEFILAALGHGAVDCVEATQDFSNLVEALGVKRDPLLQKISQSFYFQANFPTLLEDYKPVIQNLNATNYLAAGAAYGDFLSHIVETVKSKGFYYLAHTGISNGISFGLDIDLPNDTLSIWNDTTAVYDLEFTYEAAKAVADGHWWESSHNLIKYYEEKGADVLNKIPASVWEALKASEDNKKVTEKLGVDVMSKEFRELASDWIRKNPWKFHSYSKGVVRDMKSLNMVGAGALQAGLVREIANSK